ncbi:MAG: hypothetical protein LQ351_005283 [Letrouitia transgressa]|nr:MAG: hypothetical protein LQ351_005283 [Letrouitia transgressa]
MTQQPSDMAAMLTFGEEIADLLTTPTFAEEIADLLAMPTIEEETADSLARPTAQNEVAETSAEPAFRGEPSNLAAITIAGGGAAPLAAPAPLRMTDYQTIVNQFGGGLDEVQLANWNEWRYARSYEEILSLNRKYLLFLRTSTPYRSTPMNGRTYNMVPRLLRLHDLGMLTYRGEREPASFELFMEMSSANRIMYKETNRRPYLEFLLPRTIPRSALVRFYFILMKHSALFVMVYDRDGLRNAESVGKGDIPDTQFPIYRERSAPTIELLPTAMWVNFQYTFGRESKHRGRWHRWGCQAINQLMPFEFHVLSRDWNPTFDLLELIELIALRAGIEKNFQERDTFDGYGNELGQPNLTSFT